MNASPTFHLRITRRAMATEFEILMHRSAQARQVDAAVAALDTLEWFEQQLTVYSPTSEVSRINRDAAERPVPISRMMVELLTEAERLARETDGAFDVTAGPLIDVWGFTSRSGRRPTRQQIAETLPMVGWRYVELDSEQQTVRLARRGMRINLGAIGKGYVLDKIAQRLREAEIRDYLLHGGQSSIIAQGDAEPGSGSGWRIGLQHPTRPRLRVGGIWLRNRALATSGSGRQHFHFGGQRYGHVIDPRTGMPAGDMLSLTVLSSGATRADAVATGLFVAGRAELDRYAQRRPEDGLVAVLPAERQGEVAVSHWNLPRDAWSPEDTAS